MKLLSPGWWVTLGVIGGLFLSAVGLRAEADEDDRTLSPYFLVKPSGGAGEEAGTSGADAFPLKSTKVSALIAGTIAEVTVTQTYANHGQKPLEAIYVFPGSTRAAVHGLTLQVGDRRIEAEIKKRDEARATYEAAKSAGQTASLLEQQRPNVFQMNVANILPGDDVRVELRYTELLRPEEGVYGFTYPGVVGPRYSNRKASTAEPTDQWVQNPYLRQGEPDPTQFSLELTLAPGLPIQSATCTSHLVELVYRNEREATLTLSPSEGSGGNRDFVFNYKLAGPAIRSGMILSEGADENFFLLQLQPPARPVAAEMPPRDYVFVVDVSGSMHGFPLDVTRGLMRDLLAGLRAQDSFNLLLFAGSNSVLSSVSLPATPENVARALDLLNRTDGLGATELLPALQAALALPQQANLARTIAVITDGYVDVETEAFDLVRTNLNHASLFAFGIGSSINTHLIEGLARAGQGEPFLLDNAAAGPAVAKRFLDMIASPVLTRVQVAFEGFETYDVEPLTVPDLLAQRPVVIHGKWRGPKGGRVTINGLTGGQPHQETLDLAASTMLPSNEALSHLWARTRIAELGDYVRLAPNEAKVAEITALGLKYHLLTKYTSFVAVDQPVRRTTPGLETVKQPLPLPAGVSDQAVGQDVATAPEPGSVALMLTTALVAPLLYWRRRRAANS